MVEQSVAGPTAARDPKTARLATARGLSARLERLRSRVLARPTLLDGAVLLTAFVAAGVRMRHIARSEFPLNDGGMFFAMVRDLQANSYWLPQFTSYNGGDIPFSYPPVGFYIAAVTEFVLPLDLAQVFRLLPLVFSVLTVLGVFLLARSLFGSLLAATAAGIAFALVPRAFLWLIMGGGVTRAPGLFFALMALYFLDRSLQTRSRWALAWATLCSALTVLSHLETAWFLATSVPLFLLWRGRNWHGLRSTALFGLGTLALTAPWWGLMLAWHGLAPFLSAMDSGGTMLEEASLGFGGVWGYLKNPEMTSEPHFPVFWLLSLLGIGVVLGKRWFLLPAWWVSILLVGTRAAPTFVIVPMALLIGALIVEARWWLGRLGERLPDGVALRGLQGAAAGLLLVVIGFGTASAISVGPGHGREGGFLQALSEDQLEAIERVQRATPKSAEVLVLPSDNWYVDRPAEWFPALSGRVSVTTPQGQEWVPGSFDEHAYAHWRAWGCTDAAPRCLERWAQRFESFDYVFVPGPCCSELVMSLRYDRRYDAVFLSPGGALFARPGLEATVSEAPGDDVYY